MYVSMLGIDPIYASYYKTEDDMKFERRYARVRDKGYFQDTCSTFASPKKKKKSELLRPMSPVRSSPRRRALLMSRSKSELCQRLIYLLQLN